MVRYMYDHVHLISPNPVKAAEFYEHAFGATRVAVGQYPEGGTRVELRIEGTRLKLRLTCFHIGPYRTKKENADAK